MMISLPKEAIEKDVAFIPLSLLGDALTKEISLSVFEDLLWLIGRHSPQSIQIAKDGTHVPTAKIASTDCLRLCREYVASGHSIALNHAERWNVNIARILRSLGEELGCTTSSSLFFAPPNGATFSAHFDAIDVIAVQLEGCKRWAIGNEETTLPLVNATLPVDSKVVWDNFYDLSQGCALYVPRGKIHEVRATGESYSLHLSIGLASRCHADVVKRLVDTAKRKSINLRRSKLAKSQSDKPYLYELSDTTLPSLDGYSLQMAAQGLYASDLAALDQLPFKNDPSIIFKKGELGSVFERVTPCEITREHVDEGQVGLGFPGLAKGRINLDDPFLMFPSSSIASLESIRDCKGPFCVSDVRGSLSDESKLVILNRLVVEGLIQILRC